MRSEISFCRRRGGFTLVELIVAMSTGVIIAGVAGSLLWNASRQRSEVSSRAELYDIAATAMDQISRYLREITQDECPGNPTPCLLGHAQISTATAGEIRFDSYGFRLNGTALEMTNDGATTWRTMATDVSEFTLAYFDRTGNSLAGFPLSETDRESVRRIQITLELTRWSQIAKLRTGVYLRSFMDEVQTDP